MVYTPKFCGLGGDQYLDVRRVGYNAYLIDLAVEAISTLA